jgi:hypothetical protein
MKCIPALDLYLFLEGELSEQRSAEIKSHVSSCPRCRNALEARRTLLQAVDHIPLIRTPDGFSKQVLSKVNPLKPSLTEWLQAGAAALVFISLLGFASLLFSNQGWAEFMVKFVQSTIRSSREALIMGIKLIKTITIFINMFIQLTGLVIKNIFKVIPVMSTEIHVFTVALSVLIAIMIIFSFRQKFILGDKR